jgi:hypothetical protein
MQTPQVIGCVNVGSMSSVSEIDVKMKLKLRAVFAHCVYI